MKLLLRSFLILFSLWFTGCYTVPKTGRSSLSIVSEKRLAKLSETEFMKMKLQYPISANPDYNEMVQRIGRRIAEVAKEDIPDANWEFVVFKDDDQINAFAMPGGKVAVYTGLIKMVETEDELAIVIGHEIAHVAARHSNERFSQHRVKSGAMQTVSLALSVVGLGFYQSQAILAVVGAGAELGLMLPYSRKHESEADEIGLLYAAAAGYDPHAAITFWERLESGEDKNPPTLLSTHPSGKARIRRLWTKMPEAMEVYKNR